MRQTGRESEWTESDSAEEVEMSGEPIIVTRIDGDCDKVFRVFAIYQALTPTFAHDVLVEGANLNALENDQSRFIFSGKVKILERDVFEWDGFEWAVSSVTSSRQSGESIVTTALVHRKAVQNIGL